MRADSEEEFVCNAHATKKAASMVGKGGKQKQGQGSLPSPGSLKGSRHGMKTCPQCHTGQGRENKAWEAMLAWQ